jgi:hypothetical protein
VQAAELRLSAIENRLDFENIMPPFSRFKPFDVRDLIRRGVEPSPEIRKRLDAPQPIEGLTVIASLLLSPMIEKLNSEGFLSKIECGNGADRIFYFCCEIA